MHEADEVLEYITELFLSYLDELESFSTDDADGFIEGQKTAYSECLEIIQQWEHSAECGLDFDIETRFPLTK